MVYTEKFGIIILIKRNILLVLKYISIELRNNTILETIKIIETVK